MTLSYENKPLLMGVVNVTPDSFSDGGRFYDPDQAVQHGLKLVEEGADILDIGGESTRPGAKAVMPEEEQKRVLPVIKGLKKAGVSTPLSLDTRHASTMQKGLEVGADIINDVSALTHDAESLDVVATTQCPVILMHMQGTPETMQTKPSYDNVVEEVMAYLKERIAICVQAGIAKDKIILDPGIGFGKRLEDNLAILKNLKQFQALGCPVLLGASRKSFIEKICPNTPPQDRLAGSLAAALQGVAQSADILRVHDVKETAQAMAVWREIQK